MNEDKEERFEGFCHLKHTILPFEFVREEMFHLTAWEIRMLIYFFHNLYSVTPKRYMDENTVLRKFISATENLTDTQKATHNIIRVTLASLVKKGFLRVSKKTEADGSVRLLYSLKLKLTEQAQKPASRKPEVETRQKKPSLKIERREETGIEFFDEREVDKTASPVYEEKQMDKEIKPITSQYRTTMYQADELLEERKKEHTAEQEDILDKRIDDAVDRLGSPGSTDSRTPQQKDRDETEKIDRGFDFNSFRDELSGKTSSDKSGDERTQEKISGGDVMPAVARSSEEERKSAADDRLRDELDQPDEGKYHVSEFKNKTEETKHTETERKDLSPEEQRGHEIWQQVLKQMHILLDNMTYNTWLKPSSYYKYENGVHLIKVQHKKFYEKFVKQWGNLLEEVILLIEPNFKYEFYSEE